MVIGLRKPYIKAEVGTGLELIFIDKTFSVVVVTGIKILFFQWMTKR
jgi:hypothetical protein